MSVRLRYLLALVVVGPLVIYSRAGAAPPPHQLLAIGQADNVLAIYAVEGKTLALAKTLPVGKVARELCVSPDGARAYVSNYGDHTVTAVDLVSQKVVATIAPPGMKNPMGCAVSPDGKKVYVTGMMSDDVSVISTDTNEVIKRLPNMGVQPHRVVFSPDGRRYYVSAEQDVTIKVFNAATDSPWAEIVSGGHAPRTMVFLPDRKTMLVTNGDDDTVSFINTETRTVDLTLGAGGACQRIALTSDGQYALVMSALEEKISLIELKGHIRATKFVLLGDGHHYQPPYGMAMSADGTLLFVSTWKGDEILVYETAAMMALTLGARPNLPPVSRVKLGTSMGLAFR